MNGEKGLCGICENAKTCSSKRDTIICCNAFYNKNIVVASEETDREKGYRLGYKQGFMDGYKERGKE